MPDAPSPAAQTTVTNAPARSVQFDMPKSHNPLNAYMPESVPEPVLSNSAKLGQVVRDGKLYLSLKDAIDLALEDNLDLAIARYNLPIANTDILRTQAGGFFRGVNTGVVQGTPGGGVGGFGTGAPGAGAGGTTGGAGGAGAGASGLVQSTLGAGTAVSSYDPFVSLSGGDEHQTSPEANRQIYGVPSLQANTVQVNAQYSQAFATGTSDRTYVWQCAPDNEQPILQSVSHFELHSSDFRFSRNCWRDLASGRTCVICTSPKITRKFPTLPSKTR